MRLTSKCGNTAKAVYTLLEIIQLTLLIDDTVDVNLKVEKIRTIAGILYPATVIVVVAEGFVAAFQYFGLAFATYGEEVCTTQMAVQITSTPGAKAAGSDIPVAAAGTEILLFKINTSHGEGCALSTSDRCGIPVTAR